MGTNKIVLNICHRYFGMCYLCSYKYMYTYTNAISSSIWVSNSNAKFRGYILEKCSSEIPFPNLQTCDVHLKPFFWNDTYRVLVQSSSYIFSERSLNRPTIGLTFKWFTSGGGLVSNLEYGYVSIVWAIGVNPNIAIDVGEWSI